MTVLVTAFEPFGGERVNASRRVLERLEPPAGANLVRAVLPVSFARAPRELAALLGAHQPDLVLALGEAGGRSALGLERLAVNLADARIPDNDGAQPVDDPLLPDGPAAYFSSLPLRAMLAALHEDGVPAALSASAGLYVCNALMYALLHHLAGKPGVRGGFIHLPYLPEQAAQRGQPSMSADLAARAVGCCLAACLSAAPTPPRSSRHAASR